MVAKWTAHNCYATSLILFWGKSWFETQKEAVFALTAVPILTDAFALHNRLIKGKKKMKKRLLKAGQQRHPKLSDM